MATKKKEIKKYFNPKLLLVLVLLVFVAIFTWYKSTPSFQEKMDKTTWVEHRDNNIGYSFEAPEFWRYSVNDYKGVNNSTYGSTYAMSAKAFEGPYFDIYFYKDLPQDLADEMKRNYKPPADKSEIKNINGTEFTQITIYESAYQPLIRLFPKDQNTLIEFRVSYPEDVRPLSKQQETNAINRIINSIKKI